jgi:hypothetical protein
MTISKSRERLDNVTKIIFREFWTWILDLDFFVRENDLASSWRHEGPGDPVLDGDDMFWKRG